MNLLLDQRTPRSPVALLWDAGQNAVHTAEIGLAGAADEEVLTGAREERRACAASR
jgi:predicted nuclease of predicted toxin-antitoxin system